MARPVKLSDFEPKTESLRDEVLRGLGKTDKELPCKLFYDDRGARLFERITRLDEYYPTRTEKKIMHRYVGEIVDCLGPGCMLIEYGSGSSEKVRCLLDHLSAPSAYVPIDISKELLMHSAAEITTAYPHVEVLPVCADYNDNSFVLPSPKNPVSRRIVFYPGSTIGNFQPDSAVGFLRRIGQVCGPGGGLLIGVDLEKDPEILRRAYNDADGVTAAFNLNVLSRLNRELGADFELSQFRHSAFYNGAKKRVEMHVVSQRKQSVSVDGEMFSFEKGESIWTESSYKYTIEGFARLASRAGFGAPRVWMDDDKLFSVQYLTV